MLCAFFIWGSHAMLVRKNLMVFTGNANIEFANRVAKCLDIQLGKASVTKFSDGEVAVELLENVRGSDVFILQPTCNPTNDNLMEILVLTDALKRASAGRITAAIPYFGYARQDRRPRSARVPISAKLVANMLMSAGIDRVLTVDLHADQIQGFFDIPVDNIYGSPVLLKDIKASRHENLMIVSPDTGGVMRARAFAKALNVDMAIIDKRRPKANEAEVMNIIGDVAGKTCVVVDDMIDTAQTLCKAAEALKKQGAAKVSAYATHAVFSNKAIERINESILDEVVITDTIPLNDKAKLNGSKIRMVSMAALVGETIRRINNEESISLLLND
jgi:ribose-phosphate pyrophosphokinase